MSASDSYLHTICEFNAFVYFSSISLFVLFFRSLPLTHKRTHTPASLAKENSLHATFTIMLVLKHCQELSGISCSQEKQGGNSVQYTDRFINQSKYLKTLLESTDYFWMDNQRECTSKKVTSGNCYMIMKEVKVTDDDVQHRFPPVGFPVANQHSGLGILWS